MTTQTKDYVVIAANNLRCHCEIKVSQDVYWPMYQLNQQENCNGLRLSDIYGWDKCEEDDEQIVVSTPGLDAPEWVAIDCQWQLFKRDNNGENEYIEFCLIPLDDEDSLKTWYRWYDSGFADVDPDENEND